MPLCVPLAARSPDVAEPALATAVHTAPPVSSSEVASPWKVFLLDPYSPRVVLRSPAVHNAATGTARTPAR